MPKVLVVEDERMIRKITQTTFEKEGYQVESAINGKEALDKFTNCRPDIIVLDLKMPVMDGFEFMRQLHGIANQRPPVVVLTNLDSKEDKKKARVYGASEFIVKSQTTIHEVVRRVSTLCPCS